MLRPPVGPVHFLLEFLANLQDTQAAIVLYFVFFAKSGFSFFYICPLPKEHS